MARAETSRRSRLAVGGPQHGLALVLIAACAGHAQIYPIIYKRDDGQRQVMSISFSGFFTNGKGDFILKTCVLTHHTQSFYNDDTKAWYRKGARYGAFICHSR
jgi:hypothetical protein